MSRTLAFAFVSLVPLACYDKPGNPQDTDAEDSTSATDPTVTSTDTTPTTSASTSTATTTTATTTSPTSTDPSETDPSETDPTDPSETDPTSVDSSTTAPPACADGTGDPGELCFDGVVATILDVGAGAFDLGIADFDDDDALDLASLGTGATVSVLLNDGTGAFGSPDSHTVADMPCRMRIADGDGDNDPDIVVAGENLVTLINDGSAGFARNDSPGDDVFFGCGDLDVLNNNGGPLDVVYTGAYSFSYAPGTNGGTGWGFAASTDLPAPGEGAWSVTATEFSFDADTDPDVLLVNQYYSAVDIARGDGFGNFEAAGEYDACTGGGAGSRAAAIADVDGDGDEDIVTTCMAGNFTLATGNGDGTFVTSPEYLYAGAANPTFADLDDDGDPDLLVPSLTLGRINIYVNDGTTLVDDPLELEVGSPVEYCVTGDLDGDGALDVATAFADAMGHIAVFYADA